MLAETAIQSHIRRLTVLAICLAVGFVPAVGRLIEYQVIRHNEVTEIKRQLVVSQQPVAEQRGCIADAHGNLLALDLVEWEITASPVLMSKAQKPKVAETLGSLLNLSKDEILAQFTSGALWVRLAQNVPQEVGEAIAEQHLPGVECEPKSARIYPQGSLTSHVTGFVNATNEGFGGVEGFHNQELKPVPGVRQVEEDGLGNEIPSGALVEKPARSGTSLVLTLDLNVQYIAEEALMSALKEYGASSGSVVIMEPKTGAILASVSYPNYDPNDFAAGDENALRDPAVSGQWEPGSVFKVITWGAGLDSGTITPGTTMNDTGYFEVGGRLMRNWDGMAHGIVTMQYGLSRSLNVVASFVATSVGKDSFYMYLRRFGFGNVTHVDLSGEEAGTLRLPGDSNWFPSDLGTNSFGQGIAVTPIQMLAAVSAVANGGLLMKPYIVQEFIEPDEVGPGAHVVKVEPQVVRRAISEQAAETLKDMMVVAVDDIAVKAQVPGYRIAGKSSTAQIPTAAGYHPTDVIASYVAFAPADDPRFAVLVKLDRPTPPGWGTQTAAPTCKGIMERLFLYYEIPPDEIRLAQSGQ